MPVGAILDRPRVPKAAPAGPGELPRHDAHVHVSDDLAAAHVRDVVEVARRDRPDGLAERGAVIVEARVRHPEDLSAGVEPVPPVAVVARAVRERPVRLDDPIRLRVERMHRVDDVDELDRREGLQSRDQRRGDVRANPLEIPAAERSLDSSGPSADPAVLEPCLDPFRRGSREDDDSNVDRARCRGVGPGFPCRVERSDPIDDGP